ncbi:MAG: hypothetical protein HXS53_13195 [Theionarchaea archaeon]|nr:hypothetical protein [Theionarchaea archaeon]
MRAFLACFIFLSLSLLTQEADPQISAEVRPVEPNQVAVLRVVVANPSTAEMLWGNVLKIEELPPTFIPIRDEYVLSHEIRPGKTDIGELTFQVSRETEGGTYTISFSLSGGVGPCEEGCIPYFIEKELPVTVVRNEPDLIITHVVEGTTIIITLKNIGTGRAQSITCGEYTGGILTPGNEMEITIEKSSSFTVSYEDQYGKEYSQSFRILESTSEQGKDTPVQSGLVFLGIFLGYLFKKHMN